MTSQMMKLSRGAEITNIPYCCPNCGAHVGDFVQVPGGVKLDANGWLIGDGQKHCHRCGRLIHFKAPRDTWEDLVQRHLERMAIWQSACGESKP